MNNYQLGEFEEIVLLTVAVLNDDAYGVTIKQEIESRMKRKVSTGAMQTALRRMEKKGYLESEFGEATAVRGGKRKRYFKITPYGVKALEHYKDTRISLWEAIPSAVLDMKIIGR
jgi:PadR family transcriptional regulator, regulatory protein PadR